MLHPEPVRDLHDSRNLRALHQLHDLTFPALEAELAAAGVRPVHARALWASLYRQPGRAAALALPPPLARWIAGAAERFRREAPRVATEQRSRDGLTRKFLLKLHDGEAVETVLMGFRGRFTACLSTQAGCAMGCTFCATGQMGFTRHLRPGEIVAQALHCRRVLEEEAPQQGDAPDVLGGLGALRNLVLMGMGEPLHNFDAVMTALEILTDTRGLNIGPSRVTISTVGVVPGILRLAREKRPYSLAVSLHGATEKERAALVPVSRRWPLAELIAACRVYCTETGRRIFFEWTLIAGTNDSPEQARRLGALLRGLDAHVNLIPLNPTDGFSGCEPSAEAASCFQRVLREAGLPSTIRQRRGIDVAAGCGQLSLGQR